MNHLKKRSFEDGVQFAWDSTSLSCAQECPRKYYYTMVRGLRPKNSSVHLIFGGIYASALELFYKQRALGDSIDVATRKAVRSALVESWDKEAGHPIIFNDPKKTRVNLIRTLVWYIEQFGDDEGCETYHKKDGSPAVELSFALEVEDDIYFCGHLDRVVSIGKFIYVMDQKTTGGTVGPYYFRQFDLSNQMSCYSWAGKAILGSPVRGVIIDAAQIGVNFVRFERSITTRTKSQLQEWFQSALYTIGTIKHITRRWNDQGETEQDVAKIWPMNLTSCGNYGGCPFKSLCSQSPGVRENYIKADFTEHNWDPLKAR